MELSNNNATHRCKFFRVGHVSSMIHREARPSEFGLIRHFPDNVYRAMDMYVRTAGPACPTEKGGICVSPQEATGTEMTEHSYPPYIGTDQSWGNRTKVCNLT